MGMTEYPIDDCAVFYKTREEYGELSNMRNGLPLMWEGYRFHSSEALYQAQKFLPGVRIYDPSEEKEVSPFEVVMAQTNAMVSKMKAKKYASVIRPDWDDVKFEVMNYCVRLKYHQHRAFMDGILDDTLGRPIVEKSRKDRFWGAVNDYRGNLVGMNVLGELWMVIRSERPNVILPKTIFG